MATPIHSIEGVALDSTGEMVAGSLGAGMEAVAAHFADPGSVWPTLANGVDVVSAGDDWTLGNFATIVAAEDIATGFHVDSVNVEAIDQDAVFEMVLYYGAGDTEMNRVRFAAEGGFFGNARYPVNSLHIPGDSQVRAKLASSNGAAFVATIRISLGIRLHVA